MCEMYAFATPHKLWERYGVINTYNPTVFKPSYKAGPGDFMPVIVTNPAKEAAVMKWGLIPSWANDSTAGYKSINARDDLVLEKPYFTRAFKSNRCLVPANGFYEWKKTSTDNIPYYFHSKTHEIISFAGIFSSWRDPKGKDLKSFAIITSPANSLIKSVYDRMPVILEKQNEELWINPKTPEKELKGLLKPYPAKDLEVVENMIWLVNQQAKQLS